MGSAHAAHAVRTISEAGAPAAATSVSAPAGAQSAAAGTTAAPSKPAAASLPQAESSTHASDPVPVTATPAGVRTIASVAPVASTVCPEGMTAVAAPHGQIRQVGQGYDDVIGGQAVKACTTGPLMPSPPPPPPRLVAVADPPVRRSSRKLPESNPAVRKCVARAASAFGIHRLPLYLILDVEAGEVGQVSWNTNGTYDIGPAQINSWWLPTLAKAGITGTELRQDLCTNIMVSGWIYAQALQRTGSMVKAIALYHSPTEKHQYRYLGMIQHAIERRLPSTNTAGTAK